MTAEIRRKIEDVRHRNMLRRVEAIRKKHADLTARPNRDRFDSDGLDPDAWRTVNGAKVNIGEGGEIKAGMGGKYTGQKINEIGKKQKTASPELAAKRADIEAIKAQMEDVRELGNKNIMRGYEKKLAMEEQALREMEEREGIGPQEGIGEENISEGAVENTEPPDFQVADEAMKQRLQDAHETAWKNMSKSERDAALMYKGPYYQTINAAVRLGDGNFDPNEWVELFDEDGDTIAEMRMGAAIRNLDSAIDRFELNEDVIAFRGVTADFAPTQAPGEIFSGNQYFSTSIERRVGETFAGIINGVDRGGGHLLEIRVPRGTPALYLGKMSEAELLINRNAQYRVIEQATGRTVLEVVR